MDNVDLQLMVIANNLVSTFHDKKFAGEHELLMYRQACDMLTARMRAVTYLYNKIAEDGESGKNTDSS